MPKKTTKKSTTKTASKKTKKKTTKKKTPSKRYDANNKTQKTDAKVQAYLDSLPEERRTDCVKIAEIMRTITKDSTGAMWGTSIVGFGSTHLVYETGREMDWFQAGFSSRKQAISIYLMGNFESREELMEKLGPHKCGKGCLYIKRLDDVHLPTFKKLIRESCKAMKKASTD